MTIAEAGPAGRIKHNFSVTVRGVGFSTLMISSAPQSRPLSHPGLLLPRARFSLSFGFATPSLLGIHFHAFSWATRPLVLSFPYCSSPAPLQSRSFTVCPIFPLSPSFSRFNYQLFPVFQKFALKRAAFPRRQQFPPRPSVSPSLPPSFLRLPFSILLCVLAAQLPPSPSFVRVCPRSLTIFVSNRLLSDVQFPLEAEHPPRNANIHSRAPSGGSGNLVMLRFPSVVSCRSSACLFIPSVPFPSASRAGFEMRFAAGVSAARCIRASTQATETERLEGRDHAWSSAEARCRNRSPP